MSKRKCEEHGALTVEWDSEDIPDLDHEPLCYVCQLELNLKQSQARIKELEELLEKSSAIAGVEQCRLQKHIEDLSKLSNHFEAQLARSNGALENKGLESHNLQICLDMANEENGRLQGKVVFPYGTPCHHKGCLSHGSHPCEGCHRVFGVGEVVVRAALTPQDKPVCEHENTEAGKLNGTDFELCLDCGLSRSIWEQGESDWMDVPEARKPAWNICPTCKIEMQDGQALLDIMDGISDFIGEDCVCTVSPSGTAKLISCLKCPECGFSRTKQ